MLETLTELLFGTPQRARFSIYGFCLLVSLTLLLAYRVRAYRRTILTFFVVLIVFYALPLFDLMYAPPDPGANGSMMERNLAGLRSGASLVFLILSPLWMVIAFQTDRRKAREAKKESSTVFNGPWGN